MNRQRILYIGMVETQSYSAHAGGRSYVGAAAGKMLSVTAALRAAGRRAFLVSLPFPGTDALRPHIPALATSADGVPALFLPAGRSPMLRKLRGLWTLARFAALGIRRSDIVLFYNHAIEYLPGLLILRMRGVRVFQDIEDAPIAADSGLRGVLNRIGYRAMFRLSSPRKVTVSDQLGRDLGLLAFHAVQGVASGAAVHDRSSRWDDLRAGGPLHVHFGGTLQRSTGLDLFCDAIEDLKLRGLAGCAQIVAEVTGVGDLSRLRRIAAECPSGLTLRVHGAVGRDEYEAIMTRCHAGLSLKLPDEEISQTTFPSKVIEITSNGLALVATVVSDIGSIFDPMDAFLLPDATAGALSAVLRDMAHAPNAVILRARAGQQVAQSRFAPHRVGVALARFLEDGEADES